VSSILFGELAAMLDAPCAAAKLARATAIRHGIN